MSVKIVIYGFPAFSYCRMVKQLLLGKSVGFESIVVASRAIYDKIVARSHRDSVPQIFIGEQHISSYGELGGLAMVNAIHC